MYVKPAKLPKETLAAFQNDGLRARIFYEKYALRSEENKILEKTPEEMWKRIARGLASVEMEEKRKEWERNFLWLLSEFRFVPGGRILHAIGNPNKVTALNCYVLPSPSDAVPGIYKTALELAETMKRGGGCGVDISSLRPKNSRAHNAARVSTGAVSFMELYSLTTGIIGQCLPEGTPVLTNMGWEPIEKIQTGDEVWTHKGWKKVAYKFPAQTREVYEIKTKYGYDLQLSADHRLAHAQGSEIQTTPLNTKRPGDPILLLRGQGIHAKEKPCLRYVEYFRDPHNNSNRLQEISQPESLTEPLAYLLGFYAANGSHCINYNSLGKERGIETSISMCKGRVATAERLVRILEEQFHVNTRVRDREDENTTDIRISSKWLYCWLRKTQLLKNKAAKVSIPDIVKKAPDTVLSAYIAGFFDADGNANRRKKVYRFSTASKQMAKDLRLELLRLGVITRTFIAKRQDKGWQDLYTITVSGRSAQEAFLKTVGQHSEKAGAFLVKRDRNLTPWQAKDLNISRKKLTYVGSSPQKLSAAALEKYSLEVNPELYARALIIEDTVESITYIGPKTTYDIEVEDSHKFSAGGLYVSNSGRRGALMLTLSDSHPDVIDFCKIKRNRTSVRYANISVRVTDAFMQAVERDKDWLLHYENDEDRIEVKRPIQARELWNELITGARDWAEPGCLFWSTIQRYSSSDRYPCMEVVSTNPCLGGTTRILTKQGLIPIAELDGKESEIYLGKNRWGKARFWKSGRKPLYRLTLSNGFELEATPDHRIDFGGGDVTLEKAAGLRTYSCLGDGSWDGVDPEIITADMVKLGFIHGDGYRHTGGGLYATVGVKDGDVRKLFQDEGGTPHGSRQIYFPVGYRITTLAAELRIAEGNLPERRLPEAVFRISPVLAKAFLRGLYSANGSVITSYTGRVTLKTTCKGLAQDVQLLLCALGYSSYITTNRAHPVKFSNGTYVCRESYDLNLSGRWARKFRDEIGFIQSYKMEKLVALRDPRCFSQRPVKVVRIEPIGEEDVYDFSQSETSHGWANGFRVHNCGEEPLEPYGDCCLGSINLSAFVTDPFTPNAAVDLASLERATRYSVRFLDNVLTWNQGRHPLKEQEEAALRGRRIGLGIMGLADMLCQLRIKYDSDGAILYVDQLLKKIKLWAYDESVKLAEEKGPFPVFDARKHLENPFFKDFPPGLLQKVETKGLRNVTVLTIPPTGSIAAMAGVTSGIEPIFDLKYLRRSESLNESTFEVAHPLVAKYRDSNGDSQKDFLPAYFATAHTINPEKRVLMQAACQKHIDQAISSTINLPKETSLETVDNIYRMAWAHGLKGITVYREGSREGILVSEREVKNSQVEILPTSVTPRPVTLGGMTTRERTPLGTAFITINYANANPKDPFEVFVRLGKAGSDLEADAEAIGRLLSVVLRLPSPMTREERLREAIEQLEHIGGSRSTGFGPERVRSMPDGLARALSRYLDTAQNGGTERPIIEISTSAGGQTHDSLPAPATAEDFCPNCRQASLITLQGCLRCAECGYKEC